MIKTYQDLIKLKNINDRFEYLKLSGTVAEETFGSDRWVNQNFYKSSIWLNTRRDIIIRDKGCELGCPGFDILGLIIVHHLNPITKQDILEMNDKVLNPKYLICTSLPTHNAIHYGGTLDLVPVDRIPGDTKLW